MSTGLGLRIKNRRVELGMSQEELAKRMHLTSKSTICKVERGNDNLTTDTVAKYASALDCTPGYLMGWEDNATASGHTHEEPITTDASDHHFIDVDEATMELIRCFKKLSPEDQAAARTLIKSLGNDT